jgi:hypothetical protein
MSSVPFEESEKILESILILIELSFGLIDFEVQNFKECFQSSPLLERKDRNLYLKKGKCGI